MQDEFLHPRKISLLHESAGWAAVPNRANTPRCSTQEDRFLRIFVDLEGNKIEPAHYGIGPEAINDAHDGLLSEYFGNDETKVTLIGNEVMEKARNYGQIEGTNQIFEQFAVVVAGLLQAK